ncbi:UNVERIFIED_ORG: hypothetical protein M2435_000548 [Rhizobium sophorae]|uniref:Uncharacterized protein n=1 Tax=Rhizobium leguminosarum TaxID=384 RepID=A0A2Z4YH44_RHILE|nr:hypothetical protein [Rhizobium leguminosarum]AXA39445.1 hypothetical protein DLJ82_1844 [Rhizobium leguminosarum]MBB4521216.1 hypothetical protein [Rhizobium leguminosarum]MDH6657653.1 hypothetical protein [Rhizobium sophorae]TBD05987.1 hypothetical protein ELH21_16950 [Rhizobium leguminosarum]
MAADFEKMIGKYSKGLIAYSMRDIERCLTEEMNEGVGDRPNEERQTPAASAQRDGRQSTESPRADRPEMNEADKIRERLFLEELTIRKKRKKKT